jgi:hypothetical protein
MPRKRGRKELISQRIKELLGKAEEELGKHDIAPIRWLNQKLVCQLFIMSLFEQ